MWLTLLTPVVNLVMKILFNEVERLWKKEVVKHQSKQAVMHSELNYKDNKLKKESAMELLKADLKKAGVKATNKAVDVIIEKAVQRYIKN